MSAATDRPQHRDDRNGRYTYDGKWERVCVCGCTLGMHGWGAPHECMTYAIVPKDSADYKDCRCPKFRQSRKGVTP